MVPPHTVPIQTAVCYSQHALYLQAVNMFDMALGADETAAPGSGETSSGSSRTHTRANTRSRDWNKCVDLSKQMREDVGFNEKLELAKMRAEGSCTLPQ